MGWGDLAVGGLDIIELPVRPGGIFIEPYVSVLAEGLRARIDAAGSFPAVALAPPLKPFPTDTTAGAVARESLQ